MADLYKKLDEYKNSDMYPFHMPGHKRRFKKNSQLPYGLDITEITDFDNLNAPEEGKVLWRMMEDARDLYETVQSFPLVNGSTSGLMAAISACTDVQDEIIMARNSHKAVYRTAELLGLTTHYLYPEYIEEYGIYTNIREQELRSILETYSHSKCVVVTSPTYEGVILDINLISRVVHEYGMVLIVDEAHGAHLPFCRKEESAVCQGADMVIQSLHKTLPSLTQTAILHVTKEAGNRSCLNMERIVSRIRMFQSTSPSYVLMASIDECLNSCRSMKEEGLFEEYLIRLQNERKKYENLQNLHLLQGEEIGAYSYDMGKFVFMTAGTSINGKKLSDCLREEFHIECEMASEHYVIAMTSICDSDVGYERLSRAIFAIDERITTIARVTPVIPVYAEKKRAVLRLAVAGEEEPKPQIMEEELKNIRPQAMMTIGEAAGRESVSMDLNKLQYQLKNDYVSTSSIPLVQVYQPYISGGYVMCYPPGIPLLVPGEQLSRDVVNKIIKALEQGLCVLGVEDGGIKVLV